MPRFSYRAERNAKDRSLGPGATKKPGRCRSSPAPSVRRRFTTKRPRLRSRKGNASFPRLVQRQRRHRSGLKAALAHLWFVTIHPFDDGNGRIARAIADMALARSEDSPQRYYSMSAQIRLERNAYYKMLERTRRATWNYALAEMVPGLPEQGHRWRPDRPGPSFAEGGVLEEPRPTPFDSRQRTIVNRLLDGFVGKLAVAKVGEAWRLTPTPRCATSTTLWPVAS